MLTPNSAADVAIFAPGGILAGVALWFDAVNNITGPILSVLFGVMVAFLLFYRVLIARSKLKIQNEELRKLKHDNDEDDHWWLMHKFIYGILIPLILWGALFVVGDELAIRTPRPSRRDDRITEDEKK